MIRTQIYITEQESAAITSLSKTLGNGKSKLIRQAIDEFIERRDTSHKMKRLRSARGIWADRIDIPDILQSRKDFDRY